MDLNWNHQKLLNHAGWLTMPAVEKRGISLFDTCTFMIERWATWVTGEYISDPIKQRGAEILSTTVTDTMIVVVFRI